MKILGIDTSTKFLCLAIYDNSRILEYNVELGRRLSSLLNISIERALEAAGLDIEGIDYFACGLGPGSFTGLRLGMAAIKGLSWAGKKPIVGISSLDILAKNVDCADRNIVPVIDAKRNLIYSSAYKNHNHRQVRLKPYMLVTIDELVKGIKRDSLILGDAAGIFGHRIVSAVKGATVLDRDFWFPKGRHIIELALERIKNRKIIDAFGIKPIYLYPKECQVKKSV